MTKLAINLMLLVIFIFAAGCVTTHLGKRAEVTGCRWENYSMNPMEFSKFHRKLASTTKVGKPTKDLAAMISYPFVVIKDGQPQIYQNTKEVSKNYDKIFTSDVIAAIEEQNPKDVSCDFKGIAYDNKKILISVDSNKKFKIYSIQIL